MNVQAGKGDLVEIQITGMTGNYRARIIEFDASGRPRLQPFGEPEWHGWILKPGEYIILRVLSKAKRS